MSLTIADHQAFDLTAQVRAIGYRCRWHPGGGHGVVVVGQRGPGDYNTALHVRGRISLTHHGLHISGTVPPAVEALARSVWPRRLAPPEEP